MPGRLLTLLFATLLLVGTALWLTLGGDDAATEATSDAAVATADPPEAEAASLHSTTDETTAAAEAEPDQAETASREAVAEFPAEQGGPTLQVLDAVDRQPVPYAEVFVAVGGRGGMERGEWRNAGNDGEHWAVQLERGQPRKADAQGKVSLPPFRRFLRVAARAEHRFGFAVLRENQRDPTLLLVADATLRARVRDAEGHGLGDVYVSLCADLHGNLQRVARVRTGADGLAEFRHAQVYETRVPPEDPAAAEQRQRSEASSARMRDIIARAQADGRAPVADLERARRELQQRMVESLRIQEEMQARRARETQRRSAELQGGARDGEAANWPIAEFVLLAEVPQAQATQARVPPRALPKEPVELRLLPTSTLLLRLLGPDGADLRSPCAVRIRRSPDAGAPADPARQQRDGLSQLRADKPLGEHELTLGPVGLGLQLDIEVQFADDDFNFVQRGVPGPLSAAPLTIEVRSPGWFTAVAGRFVDEQGQPIPGLDAELFVSGAKGRVEGERLRLEPDGRFELPVRLREAQPPYVLEVRAAVAEKSFGKLLALPVLVNGKRTDVGDVVLRELPILVHGVVRNDLDRPIAGAQVVVQAQRTEGWTDESFLSCGSDAEGKFELRAEARPLRLRLRVTANGHANFEQEIAFGERVDLRLPRLGGIRAQGFRPQFLPREAVRVTLADLERNQSRELDVRPRDGDGFELRVDDLRPGLWRVMLHVRGLPKPMALAESVLVKPGETTRPAALDGLDLRSRVFLVSARAIDQAGQPFQPDSPLLVQLYDGRGMPQWVPFPWRGANIELLLDAPGARVVGLASGCQPVRAELQAGGNELRFSRTHPVKVLLPGLRELLGPQQSARISLVYADPLPWPEGDLQTIDQRNGQGRGYQRTALGKSNGAGLGAADEVTMPLMLNGRYEVVLRIDGVGGRVSKTIAQVEVIVDGPKPQTITAIYDSNLVRDAVAELRARPQRR